MKELNLPEPIAAYFHADKRDGRAVASCFANHGHVTDEGRTHVGASAIEAWKDETSTRFSYRADPVSMEKTDRTHIVTSRVSGTFPGSPVDLRFIFSLEHDKIASLEITP